MTMDISYSLDLKTTGYDKPAGNIGLQQLGLKE